METTEGQKAHARGLNNKKKNERFYIASLSFPAWGAPTGNTANNEKEVKTERKKEERRISKPNNRLTTHQARLGFLLCHKHKHEREKDRKQNPTESPSKQPHKLAARVA